ncbi:MAG: tetratricopeptide repeat protein [Bacteroides uniformis]
MQQAKTASSEVPSKKKAIHFVWNIKRHKEAFESLSSALSLYTENDADRYLCLGNLAIVESELGDSAKEQSYFKKALAHILERSHILAADKHRKHPSRLYYLIA